MYRLWEKAPELKKNPLNLENSKLFFSNADLEIRKNSYGYLLNQSRSFEGGSLFYSGCLKPVTS